MDRLRYVIALAGTIALLTTVLPNAAALPPCLIQSVTYDFPSSVAPGQSITVQTHLKASCVQWPPYATAYSIRVDLTNLSNGYVLSTTTYQVGWAQTYIDQVFYNTATAPNSKGDWHLRVDLYIWGGDGQLLIHLTDYAKLPIG